MAPKRRDLFQEHMCWSGVGARVRLRDSLGRRTRVRHYYPPATSRRDIFLRRAALPSFLAAMPPALCCWFHLGVSAPFKVNWLEAANPSFRLPGLPGLSALAGVSRCSRIFIQWSGLSWSELPPLQSGQPLWTNVGNRVALGPDLTA